MATLDGPSRLPNLTPDTVSNETLTMVTGLAVSNMLSLVLFFLALTGAVIWGSRPDRHKRLMIWASLFVLGPAVGRISRWPIFGDIAEPAFVAIWMLSVVIVISYEFWTLRRPHPMTLATFRRKSRTRRPADMEGLPFIFCKIVPPLSA
jgi:hypothetical protein